MNSRWFRIFLVGILLLSAALLNFRSDRKTSYLPESILPDQFLVVLGITQDAGYPQTGCESSCCAAYWNKKETRKYVSCLALVDRKAGQYWLLDATPDLPVQLKNLQHYLPLAPDYTPDGILLTHAHTGHYTGLMQFGREVQGAADIPVYAMPRMDSFLRHNGPWSQLIGLRNIRLLPLRSDSSFALNPSLRVRPILVPHRDEFSETVGFAVEGPAKKILYLPDIDKWDKWDRDIGAMVNEYDLLFIDGTFYRNGELPGRDMREVPHPFVEETVWRLSHLPDSLKQRIHFIHFNHSNPLLKKTSEEKEQLRSAGFRAAEEGMLINL
ncbi:MAG: pyrroloquinoline quinone biosynthesis protein PqqB [Chitinophagaceae bacterium]|nr:pyrroloquinoline quinone biosynthesis protein PqqB [Chitinophagaceae bacterium]